MIQWVGAGCIILATSLWGWRAAWAEENRLMQLSDLEKSITLLKSEISFALRPLSDALLAISERQNGMIGTFLADAGNRLASLDYGGACEAWDASIAGVLPGTTLNPEDIAALEDFGHTLGYLDRQAQLAACDLLLEYLGRSYQEGFEKANKNKRVYKSLGLLSGVLLAVVLL